MQALLWDSPGACAVSTTGISVCFNEHMELVLWHEQIKSPYAQLTGLTAGCLVTVAK